MWHCILTNWHFFSCLSNLLFLLFEIERVVTDCFRYFLWFMSTVLCLQLGIMEFSIKHLLDFLPVCKLNYTSMEMSRLTQCIIYIIVYNCSSYMLYILYCIILFPRNVSFRGYYVFVSNAAAAAAPPPPSRHNFVVSAITFEGFKLRSSNLTHGLFIQISRTSSITDIVVQSNMAAGGHFVQKLKKKKSCVSIWNGKNCDRKLFSDIQNFKKARFPTFLTFHQFSPVFTTFHNFSPLFTTFPTFSNFFHFFPLFPTFSSLPHFFTPFSNFSPLLATFPTFPNYSPRFPYFFQLFHISPHFFQLFSTFQHF